MSEKRLWGIGVSTRNVERAIVYLDTAVEQLVKLRAELERMHGQVLGTGSLMALRLVELIVQGQPRSLAVRQVAQEAGVTVRRVNQTVAEMFPKQTVQARVHGYAWPPKKGGGKT